MGVGGGGYNTSTYKYSTTSYDFARFNSVLEEALLGSCFHLLVGDSIKKSP